MTEAPTEAENPFLEEDDDESTASTDSSSSSSPQLTEPPTPLEEWEGNDDEPVELPKWKPSVSIRLPEDRKRTSIYSGEGLLVQGEAAVSVPSGTAEMLDKQAARPRKKNGRTYNRKLLNKHDDRLLLFLAKVSYCNTRQLSIVMGKTERQVQQKLKGLQELGLTDNRIMANTKALWVCTAKGIRKLEERGVIPADHSLHGRRATDIKDSAIGHKLAIATVAAQLVSGWNTVGLTDLDASLGDPMKLVSESEIARAWAAARKRYRLGNDSFSFDRAIEKYENRTDGQKDRDGRAAMRLDLFKLYPHRQVLGTIGKTHAKLPDMAVEHPKYGFVAIEVELHEKSLEDYVEILRTYNSSSFIRRVVYVSPTASVAKLVLKAADIIDAEKVKERYNDPDFIRGYAHENWSPERVKDFLNGFTKTRDILTVMPLYDNEGQLYTASAWLL